VACTHLDHQRRCSVAVSPAVGDFAVDLPRPRGFAHPGFIALRKKLGDLIGMF